ncbi:unnamed protein product [Tuber aestivum]|uniref:Oxidoreductase n=1 Tax=Tuber aestivum TaxID=59557 RepID=A0A292Q586_9PEZI|nr:unnamed protein product [Tuber aestivum]
MFFPRLFRTSCTTIATYPRVFSLQMSHSAMSARLAGKTVLITGASSGIGRSTAIEFSRTSPTIKLIVAARREEVLRELAAAIEKESAGATKVLPARLDVSDPVDVKGFLARLPEEWREVDILVNNAYASVAPHCCLHSVMDDTRSSLLMFLFVCHSGLVKGVETVGNIAEEDIDVMFSSNVTGLVNMTQLIMAGFKSRDRGDIINVGSIAGREPYPGGSIYCATKAAVRSFTDSLRRELISTRIRVMEIDPGQVETEFSLVRFRGDKAKADGVYAGCEPLTPGDIAEIIVFAAGRRENVVLADMMVYPSHQAGVGAIHKES